jgi:hypothetical protein
MTCMTTSWIVAHLIPNFRYMKSSERKGEHRIMITIREQSLIKISIRIFLVKFKCTYLYRRAWSPSSKREWVREKKGQRKQKLSPLPGIEPNHATHRNSVPSILPTPQHIPIINYFQNTTSQINNRPIWMRTDASNSLSPLCKSFSKCIYRKACLKLFELHS